MSISLNLWPTLAFAVVMASWFGFVIVFLVRKKPPATKESKRDPISILGIALQGAAYGFVWAIRRHAFTPIASFGRAFEIASSILTMILAVASVWFVSASVRTLGKQWSLAARVVEGHKLVTEGPYSIVRNPIYTGMFGMLLATGLAFSHWVGLLIGIIVFMMGTTIRVNSEEKLLREAFGGEWESYAEHVPAVIPFLHM